MKLTIKGLTKSYGSIRALSQFSYEFGPGIYGILGANGAGKSTLFELLTDTLRRDCGEILWNGVDILKLGGRYRAKVGYMPQAQGYYPQMTAREFLYYMGRLKNIPRKELVQGTERLLTEVGLSAAADRKLGQFSGGMRQRVMIAMGLICHPQLLIADEPTTALDVTIQAQIIELMQEMQEKNGNAIIMITHDLGVVADMADKIMVMYAGRPVEFGTAEEIFYESRHPYTWGLIRSIPEQAIEEKKPLTPIHGNPPSLMNLPEGCVFSPRCPYATDKCRKQRPERVVTESGHYSACHYSGDPEFLKNAPETSRTRKDSKKGGEA